MSSLSGQKRQRDMYKCLCCGEIQNGWKSFMLHVAHSPLCAEREAGCELYDPQQAATTRLNTLAGESSYAADIQSHMVQSYSELYYEKFVQETTIQSSIQDGLVSGMISKMKAEVYRRLARTPAEEQELEKVIGTVFDVHQGIETAQLRHGVLSRTVHPVKPQKRGLIDRPDGEGLATGPRSGDYVYDVPVPQELESMLASDPSLLSKLKAASDSWAQERPEPAPDARHRVRDLATPIEDTHPADSEFVLISSRDPVGCVVDLAVPRRAHAMLRELGHDCAV